MNVLYWHFKPNVSPPLSSFLCKEFILGVCVQEVFQQAFSLFLPKKFVKFERVLVSSNDRLVAFRAPLDPSFPGGPCGPRIPGVPLSHLLPRTPPRLPFPSHRSWRNDLLIHLNLVDKTISVAFFNFLPTPHYFNTFTFFFFKKSYPGFCLY